MALTKVQQGMSDTLVSGTAVTASGTSVDFTGIPAGVKRVTVMFSGVSTNGASNYLVQLGTSSGIENTSYGAYGSNTASASLAGLNYTTGFGIRVDLNTRVVGGAMVLTSVTGNAWASTHSLGSALSADGYFGGGSKTLAGTLDRVRITTVNGTDVFDAGTINIMYE